MKLKPKIQEKHILGIGTTNRIAPRDDLVVFEGKEVEFQ
jgi:hypothetical protein